LPVAAEPEAKLRQQSTPPAPPPVAGATASR
jgi:hypothetical protein